jgi:hypothetical protein
MAGPSASPGLCRAGNDRALPWKTVATRSRPRQAAVETGDYANAGLRQGARQRSQIVRTNRHVAISHDDERMTRDLPHVDEVGDLTVGAVRGAVNDEMNIKLRISLDHRFDDRDCVVVRVLGTENQLNFAG